MADNKVAAAKAARAVKYRDLVRLLDPYGLHGKLTIIDPNLSEDFFVENCNHFVPWLERIYHCLKAQEEPTHKDHKNQYYFEKGIIVESVTWFGKPYESNIGFAKIQADLVSREKYTEGPVQKRGRHGRKPGAVFLRGGSVAILMVLQARHHSGRLEPPQAVVVRQTRIAAGSFDFVELPAGMVDEENGFVGAAAAEIEQEIGIKISKDELLDMTQACLNPDALRSGLTHSDPAELHDAFYPSMGACDEYIRVFFHGRYVTPTQLATYKGKATGLFQEGEDITVDVVPLKDLWRLAGRDGKTHAALSLYYGLKDEGWEFKMKPIEDVAT